MMILNSPEVVQETALRWKKEYRIALVPTMGGLHEGHLALVRKAREVGQKCIVSIFVNPLQFAPHEDFAMYPRTVEEDETKLREFGVDCLFLPSEKELYPPLYSTRINVGSVATHLCGLSRPTHFEGVATVCLKLFHITMPDFAIFGEKDFQQLRVIQKMTEDLNLPVTIISHPIVRDQDGLALSTRNSYLSKEERKKALHLPRALVKAVSFVRSRKTLLAEEVLRLVRQECQPSEGTLEYAEITSENDLVPVNPETEVHSISQPRLFAALRLGNIRLIDNISLSGMVG